MGHNIGVSRSYYHPKESEVLEDYLKAIDALTIDPKQRLEKKVRQLEGQQGEEIARLKTELDKTREDYRNVLVTLDEVKTGLLKLEEQEEQQQKVLQQRMEYARRIKRGLEDPDPEHRSNFITQELQSNPPKHLPPWLAAELHLPARQPNTVEATESK
jgi:chromosome segregation ATPase